MKNIEGKKHSQKAGQVCPLSNPTINWQTHTDQEMFILLGKWQLLSFEIKICCQVQISSSKIQHHASN